jgi:hypothetical protein
MNRMHMLHPTVLAVAGLCLGAVTGCESDAAGKASATTTHSVTVTSRQSGRPNPYQALHDPGCSRGRKPPVSSRERAM